MAGIGRIEERMKNNFNETDKNISVAFQDIKNLMGMAQQMASISRSIANKIKDHGSEVTDDETVRFKSFVMDLGIEQQIDIGVEGSHYSQLAKQIESVVIPVMEKYNRNQMTLCDVYCIINRARGVNLVSPEDVTNACRSLDKLEVVRNSSGLVIVQIAKFDEKGLNESILNLAKINKFLTPIKLSQMQKEPLQLARHRLEQCEKVGLLCRDTSVAGLRFYPNYFLLSKDII